jgi:hypothetical protein
MRNKQQFFYFTTFGLLLLFNSCTAQNHLTRIASCNCMEGLNKIDEKGRPVGYWKQSLPDSNGHFRIIYEGLYFRGRKVGAWKRTNWDGSRIYQHHIFIDTMGVVVHELNYDADGRITSSGILKSITLKDSIQTIDPRTNKLKWDTLVQPLVKEGFWQFFWPNGQLKAAGNFKNDKQSGRWSHYNTLGEFVKSEEY